MPARDYAPHNNRLAARYLRERFADQLKTPVAAFHYVQGDGDPVAECKRLNSLIEQYPIDVAFIGIGENGHLAFNDPPCNMSTKDPYIVVDLDEACRQQQLGEARREGLRVLAAPHLRHHAP